MRGKFDKMDAVLWVIVPSLVLACSKIGIVSGDGLTQGSRYLVNGWTLNPNHFLYEPAGAIWLQTISALFPSRHFVDVLKLLSIGSGAIAIGLFRLLSDSVFVRRASRNFATAAFAFGSGFLVHWISDETHMVQMPWLVLLAFSLHRFCTEPSIRTASIAGIATSLSALWYISNVLVGALAICAICFTVAYQGQARTALKCLVSGGVSSLSTLLLGLGVGWSLSTVSGKEPFANWILSYGGGSVNPRVAGAYGLEGTFRSLLESVARAAFGSASAVVDQTALASQLRGEADNWLRVGGDALALVCMLVVLASAIRGVRGGGRHVSSFTAAMAGWTLGVLVFAIVWNNSDAQFYFQLAVPFGLAVGAAMNSRALSLKMGAASFALAWNLFFFIRDGILFPRQFLIEQLRSASAGANLVVVPGHDTIEQLLFFVGLPKSKRLSITDLAEQQPAVVGIPKLDSTIGANTRSGGIVITVGIIGANPRVIPWRYVDKLGYKQSAVENSIETGRNVEALANSPFAIHRVSDKQ